MKNIRQYFILLFFLPILSCGDANSAKKVRPENNFAEIKFDSEKFDVGVIDGKTNADHDFKFWNVGGDTLILTEVKGNCHCVYTKWPQTPILPGDSSVISVSFDPKDVDGLFIRTAMVKSNATRPAIELTLSGEIKRDPKK